MHSFASSTFSLPASAEKKFKKTILRRLSLGKDKTSSDLSRSSSTVNLASRSTATLTAAPSEECASRRAFDLFSSYSQSPDIDAYASIPSSPRMPKAPTFGSNSKISFDARIIRNSSSRVRSSSAMPRASPSSRKDERKAPPAPKLFLMSNEVFVIAAPPKKSATTAAVPVPVPVIMPRYSGSSSYSAASSSPMLSSVSSRSSGSWLDNLGISLSSEEEMPAFPESVSVQSLVAAELVRSRSSLDDIDYQLLANLCEFPVVPSRSPARMTRSESGHGAPEASRGRARSASHQMAPPVPAVPAHFTRSHVRSGSAPLSLGPLPPQPSQPPTEAVLRRMDQIKKRYSRQGSPLYTSSPMFEDAESAFLSPRTAPGTPKVDRTLDLKFLEAGLSLDSKVAKRSHKGSASKSGSKSFDSHFTLLKDLKLTPGHIATPKDKEPQELVSRFSENSDSGRDDASRLFSSLLSHKPGNASASKLPPLCTTYTISDAGTSDDCRRNSGIKTPEMVARSSSSSSSSYSDLPEIVSINVNEIVFDLSRPSLDYRQVYAMAQEYAKSSGSVARGAKVASKKKQPAVQNGLDKKAFGLWNKSNRQLLDPVDRSYHLRKY